MNFVFFLAKEAPIEPPVLDFDITALIQVGLFVLILLFLNKYVVKPYLVAREERDGLTDGAVEDAQQLRTQADEAEAKYVSKRQVVYAEIESERKRQLREAQEAQTTALTAKREIVMRDIAKRQAEFDQSMKVARSEASTHISVLSAEITRKLLA